MSVQRERPGVVGRHVRRLDAEEKVEGRVEYVDDLDFAGLKHVAVCRSTVPHGRLVSIDTWAAETLPGVRAVLTREDVRRLEDEAGFTPYFGPAIRDQPVLALEKVHYVGDPVAAVVADDRDTAREAADLVEVEYEKLDYCTTVEEALEVDAPIVHKTFEAADTFDDLEHVESGENTNEAFRFTLRHGDAAGVLAEANRVFEGTYRTPAVQHMPLEPHVAVARVDPSGRLEVWTANQSPHFIRGELASMFGLPESKVRVEVPQVGGSYGAKLYTKLEPLVAFCAHVTGHTVKLRQSVEESFDTITRHATTVRLQTAVADDGTILARACHVYYDTGAYAEIGPRITKKSGYTAAGPYEIPAVSIDAHCVYTNKPPAGAFRGFGVPQLVAAYEAQMDDMAHELGIDPVEIRERNGFVEGSIHPTGAPVDSVGLLDCLEAVAAAAGWGEPLVQPGEPHLVRGRGVAVGYKACITPSSSGAIVALHGDGSVTVHSGSVEIGQGVRTTLAQLVAEALGVDLGRVTVARPDTDVSPFDTITAGSRSTFHMGNAAFDAVEDVKAQLRGITGREWAVSPAEVDVRDGTVTHPGSGRSLSLADTVAAGFGAAGGTVVGRGYFTSEGGHHDPETGQSDNPSVFWFFGATSAVVDVDIETGRVEVRELHNAADVGRAIDPDRVRGQILGGAAHALGQTLHEEMVFEFGQQVNRSLLDYKLPALTDMPDEQTAIIVEVKHDDGPLGAKGVGETGSFAVSPAITNAVLDATGVRVPEIPLTPERVLRAIEEGPP